MASETGCVEDLASGRSNEAGSDVGQALQGVEDRLLHLSEKIVLCKMVENDLKDLLGVLERKSLQDVSLPLQKGTKDSSQPLISS